MLRWTEEPAFATVCLDKDKMSAILRNLLMAFTDSMDPRWRNSSEYFV